MNELAGKRVIVTGGASGIGKASAQLFVSEGARVVIADIDGEAARACAAELGPAAEAVKTDVADAAQVEALVEQAVAAMGGIDVMFNNAGIAEKALKVEFLDDDLSRFAEILNVDLLGPMLGARYAGRAMRDAGQGGVILNTASIAGFHAGYGLPVYRAAKAGVIAFTRMLAIELGRYGIRANSISPGAVRTDWAGVGFSPVAAGRIGEAAARHATIGQALERTGEAADIAHAALFLASDRARHITGHNLVVDGGTSVGDKLDRIAAINREIAQILAEDAVGTDGVG